MKNIILTILIIFSIDNFSIASDCKDLSINESRQINIKSSTNIFTGIILNVYKDSFEIFVTESFKGTFTKGDIIKGNINNYVKKPIKGQFWLIYSNYRDSVLLIDECSISRCIEDPVINRLYIIPYELSSMNQSKQDDYFNKLHIKAINDFFDEINYLRKLDNQKITSKSKYSFIIPFILGFFISSIICFCIKYYYKT